MKQNENHYGLAKIIEELHGCKATYVKTVPVLETWKDQVVWDGEVELFSLEGHPKASKCYAWAFDKDGKPEYVTVLELPPVDSALKAVQTYIVSKIK